MILKQLALALTPFMLVPATVQGQQVPLPAEPSSAGAVTALVEPANGVTLSSLGPVLQWINPAGATQYHLQVIPFNNDGPGINIIGSGGNGAFRIPAAPEWYGLLPDMTYAWRLRTAVAMPGVDPVWGQWSERRFRTPAVSSNTLSLHPTSPSATPALQWSNSRSDVFYYEVQLSRDVHFNADPRTATAPIYSAIIHGGITGNSYQVPASHPLDAGATYHWRVRPRVQGDGRPVSWSRIASFVTPGAPVVAASPGAGLEQQALGIINQVRQQHGLETLAVAAELAEAAHWHSADMAARGSMSHTGSDGSGPADRISAAGYDWRVYGEIVAAGYISPQTVVDAWMNSPSHRDVILLPELREFGAGLVYASGGRPYWTVNFGTR